MMSEEDHDLNINVKSSLGEVKGTEKYMGCEWQIQLNTDNHRQYMYIGSGTVIIHTRSIS